MNSKLAEKISRYLLGEEKSIDYKKIKYYLESIIGELEKLILIVVMFSVFGYILEIIITMFVMILIRPYVGGTHFNRYWICFLYTTFVCFVTIILGEIIVYNKYVHILAYVFMLLVIVVFAPIKSEYRPRYEGMVRVKIKARALFWLIVIGLVDTLVLNGYEMLVASVLYILSLDVIKDIVCKNVFILYLRTKRCYNERRR